MRVRSLAHGGGAELEDHGGAQEAQEADPGNIHKNYYPFKLKDAK